MVLSKNSRIEREICYLQVHPWQLMLLKLLVLMLLLLLLIVRKILRKNNWWLWLWFFFFLWKCDNFILLFDLSFINQALLACIQEKILYSCLKMILSYFSNTISFAFTFYRIVFLKSGLEISGSMDILKKTWTLFFAHFQPLAG